MDTDMPLPVRLILPLYVPAALNPDVLTVTDRLAGFAWLTLRLLAESPIQDGLAWAVRDTVDAEVVLT
jgi:hypothetical protein